MIQAIVLTAWTVDYTRRRNLGIKNTLKHVFVTTADNYAAVEAAVKKACGGDEFTITTITRHGCAENADTVAAELRRASE